MRVPHLLALVIQQPLGISRETAGRNRGEGDG
jgi:hypothetical protein